MVGGKVVIVIGGDDNYTENEEERSVISIWARRALSRQISEEYLDGRKSFIFSWDKKHRPIHEEALKHFFDPGRNGKRFTYPTQADPGAITNGCSEKEPALPDLGRIEGAAEIEPTTPAEATPMEVEEEKGIYFIVTRCFWFPVDRPGSSRLSQNMYSGRTDDRDHHSGAPAREARAAEHHG